MLQIFFQIVALAVTVTALLPPIHYTISRRGGSFPAPDIANISFLLEQLQDVEQRFGATTRTFNGNKVVRKPKRVRGTQAGTVLLGEVGREGNWFASLHIGEPMQNVDMDLDMLTADWWIFSTSSSKGSFYLDFNSTTYVDSESPLSFPTCREPKDIIHLPTVHRSIPISFAHCRPSKQWTRSLLPSGAYLGLAPSDSLSQLKTISLMPQLIEKSMIEDPVWSLILLNGKEGIFSMGGTSVASVRQVEKETEDGLARLKNHKEIRNEKVERDRISGPETGINPSNEWKWTKVHGADGWWQILMRGIWVDGIKILENQQVVLDVNTPFIVAPPMAARSFYSSISGSRQLSAPYDQFHAYPCFNPPKIHFEFAQWNVQVLKGKRDKGTFSPGGRFSLGRMAAGSGYCIGIIVESSIGRKSNLMSEGTSPENHNKNGLTDDWIIGEPFFRDVQVAFDWKTKRVGMQKA